MVLLDVVAVGVVVVAVVVAVVAELLVEPWACELEELGTAGRVLFQDRDAHHILTQLLGERPRQLKIPVVDDHGRRLGEFVASLIITEFHLDAPDAPTQPETRVTGHAHLAIRHHLDGNIAQGRVRDVDQRVPT